MTDIESLLRFRGGGAGGVNIQRRQPGTQLPSASRAQNTSNQLGGRLQLFDQPQAPAPQVSGRQRVGNALSRIGGALAGEPQALPNIRDQPLSSIGLLLSNVAAGLQGRQLPTERLFQLHQQQKAQEMQRASFLFDAVNRAIQVNEELPAEQREQALAQIADAVGRVAPGFDIREFVAAPKEFSIQEFAPDLASLTPSAQRMALAAIEAEGGSARDAARVLNDRTFRERLLALDDVENRSSIAAKAVVLRDALQQFGINPAQVRLPLGEFEVINQQLPQQLGLTHGELRTLRRSPELQQALGIEQPELTQLRQVERIRAGFRQGAGRELATVTVQFPDGEFRTFRRDDAGLDQAINQGAVQVGLSAVGTPQELGEPTTASRSRAFETLETGRQTLGMINDFRALVDQSDIGVAASVRRLAQGAGAQAEAFSSLLGGAAQQTISQIEQRGDQIAPGIFALDPGLSTAELLGNIMAYQLAVQQQGGGRVSDQDFRSARQALGIDRPLANIGDVMQKLELLERQTVRQLNQARGTLGLEQEELPSLPGRQQPQPERQPAAEPEPAPQTRAQPRSPVPEQALRRIVPQAENIDDAVQRIGRMNASQLAGINVDDLNGAPPEVQEAFRVRVEQLLREQEETQNRTEERTRDAQRRPFLGLGGF